MQSSSSPELMIEAPFARASSSSSSSLCRLSWPHHQRTGCLVVKGRELSLGLSYCQIDRALLGIGRYCDGSWVIPRALLVSNWPSILRHRKLLSGVVSYPSRPLTVKVTENCWAHEPVVTGCELSLAPSYSQIDRVLFEWRVIPRDLVLSNSSTCLFVNII